MTIDLGNLEQRPGDVLSLIWGQFKMETERMVDSLSYVLAPHMPKWKGQPR